MFLSTYASRELPNIKGRSNPQNSSPSGLGLWGFLWWQKSYQKLQHLLNICLALSKIHNPPQRIPGFPELFCAFPLPSATSGIPVPEWPQHQGWLVHPWHSTRALHTRMTAGKATFWVLELTYPIHSLMKVFTSLSINPWEGIWSAHELSDILTQQSGARPPALCKQVLNVPFSSANFTWNLSIPLAEDSPFRGLFHNPKHQPQLYLLGKLQVIGELRQPKGCYLPQVGNALEAEQVGRAKAPVSVHRSGCHLW